MLDKAQQGRVQGGLPLGKGGHELGVVTDEARVDKLLLQVLPHQLVQQPGCRLGRRTLHTLLFTLHKQAVHTEGVAI